jgi:hypothetical protein
MLGDKMTEIVHASDWGARFMHCTSGGAATLQAIYIATKAHNTNPG